MTQNQLSGTTYSFCGTFRAGVLRRNRVDLLRCFPASCLYRARNDDKLPSILVRPHMEFRAGSSQDAEAIAGLIASFQSELTDDPSGADAEEYLASVSVRAERAYLASARYRYLLAYSGSQLVGFIAIRDGSHLL